ncbi:MAG: PEP-CTERM/exosortase system-associated acyltransferase [Porticoccaceae bacterium]|nr:PEP-CTERM/exosortase system-associated acyltransferase [Porticoccaceae bacterium]
MANDNRTLAARFHEYFDIELATTPEKQAQVYKIRYRVYCEEFGFLPAEHYPDGLEKDEYDDFSHNCLITHKLSKMPAACVRLIPAVSEGRTDYPLPYELLGPDVLDRQFFERFDVPKETLCEISRLAVDGAFRRRSGEAATRFGEIDALHIEDVERRTFGLISVAAFLASAALGDLYHLTNGFAMMEPFLPRLMERSGIRFERAGVDIDYHGIRAPYFVQLGAVLDTMHADLKEFYQSIHKVIEKQVNNS